MKKLRVLLALVLAMALALSITAFGASAAEEAYTPNRYITLTNNGDTDPLIRMEALPYNFGANGPYHLVGYVSVEDFEAIDDSMDAYVIMVVTYGNYDDVGNPKNADKTQIIGMWSADTNGFEAICNEDGSHIVLDEVDTDYRITFQMINCNGKAAFGDLIIADADDEIAYSLANDSCFRGITDLRTNVSSDAEWLWRVAYDTTKTSCVVTSCEALTYDYTPNVVVSIDIPAVEDITSGANPQGNAYCILDFGSAIFAESQGPYTIRGMIKVENFAISDYWIGQGRTPAQYALGNERYTGDTNGWVPILRANGKPVVVDTNGWWDRLLFSWATTGKFSIADLQVLDKDGNVVYSFEGDAGLVAGDIAMHTNPTATTPIYFWGYDFGCEGHYVVEKAATITEHTADDYALLTVDEEYVPYVPEEPSEEPSDEPSEEPSDEPSDEPSEDPSDDLGNEESEPNPDSGVTGSAAAAVALVAAAAALLLARKKED